MSSTVTFDTLEFVEELKAAGVPEQQAMAQVRILSKATRENLVTQQHLDLRIAEIKGELLLIKWMLALIIAATVLPVLKSVFVV